MRVAVIGAGNIGGTIGRAWLAAGHDVAFGVTEPQRYGDLAEAGARVALPAEAVRGAEAVLLAVPGNSVNDVLAQVAPALRGAVIDATNNVGGGGSLNASEAVAAATKEAAYYRAFNTLGWENFAMPIFESGERADLFYAGMDGPGREVVERLIEDVGLRPVWVGGPEHVETVDGIARLWFALVMGRRLPRHTAFKMLSE